MKTKFCLGFLILALIGSNVTKVHDTESFFNCDETANVNAGSNLRGTANRYSKFIDQFEVYDGNEGGATTTNSYYYGSSVYYENANQYGTIDDYAYEANIIGDTGTLKGKLSFRNDEIDKDYYRFSIHERRKYKFTFSFDYSKNYYFDIYSFETNKKDFISQYNQDEHCGLNRLLYSSRNSGREKELTLVPGTYYICVTSSTKSKLREEYYYSLKFGYYRVKFDNYVDSANPALVLNDNKVIIWENEDIPSNVDIWSKDEQVICEYSGLAFYKGYVDPISRRDTNCYYYSEINFKENYELASIVYVNDPKIIKEIKDVANKITNETLLNDEKKEIERIETEKSEDGKTIFFKFFGKTNKLISVIEDALDYIETFKILKEFMTKETTDDNSVLTGSAIVANAMHLFYACKNILDHPEDNEILKLPKYYKYVTVYKSNEPRKIKVVKTPFLQENFGENYFRHNLYSNVHYLQLNHNKLYSGKIKCFKTVSDFENYKNNFEGRKASIVGAYTNACTYSVEKSGSQYRLKIKNLTSSSVYVRWNNKSIGTGIYSDYAVSNYNFGNNGYKTECVFSGDEVSYLYSFGNFYIREGSKPYVTNVYYDSNAGKSVCKNPMMIEQDHLKISAIEKSGSTWSIRIRNVSNKEVFFYYNTKLCYESDAEEWKNLKDWSNTRTRLMSEHEATVQIKTNWFADSVAISYVDENAGVRYISYGMVNSSSITLTYKMADIAV